MTAANLASKVIRMFKPTLCMQHGKCSFQERMTKKKGRIKGHEHKRCVTLDKANSVKQWRITLSSGFGKVNQSRLDLFETLTHTHLIE